MISLDLFGFLGRFLHLSFYNNVAIGKTSFLMCLFDKYLLYLFFHYSFTHLVFLVVWTLARSVYDVPAGDENKK